MRSLCAPTLPDLPVSWASIWYQEGGGDIQDIQCRWGGAMAGDYLRYIFSISIIHGGAWYFPTDKFHCLPRKNHAFFWAKVFTANPVKVENTKAIGRGVHVGVRGGQRRCLGTHWKRYPRRGDGGIGTVKGQQKFGNERAGDRQTSGPGNV